MAWTQIFSNADLEEAIRRNARKIDAESISRVAYDELRTDTEPSGSRIVDRFGSWNQAIEAAGLKVWPSSRKNIRMRYTNDELYEAFKKATTLAAPKRLSVGRYEQLRTEYPELPSSALLRKRLGRWNEIHEVVS